MWYWNQQNFEGLIAVADSIADQPQWNLSAQYCRLRERGLRPQALQAITELIAEAAGWGDNGRRQFADWIYSTSLRNPEVHKLIPTPLNQQLLVPTLRQWAASESSNAIPERWLGFATGDHQHFSNALSLDPTDDISRYRLVSRDLADVDHQCHHLPDCFIGEIDTAIMTLDRAKAMAAKFSSPDIAPTLEDEFSELYGKVRDWQTFQGAGGDSFGDWCIANGRVYHWLKAYYYER
ncbi:hypothetical protein [Roseimaritima sediminicola]|uniref:hypothetical protein n=1 Tax=Roseimaritima sediminicola TaxID=2662066 RepID=UPI0012983A0C|nr:hypothetical protein [Roseimaritima sediminicola]